MHIFILHIMNIITSLNKLGLILYTENFLFETRISLKLDSIFCIHHFPIIIQGNTH